MPTRRKAARKSSTRRTFSRSGGARRTASRSTRGVSRARAPSRPQTVRIELVHTGQPATAERPTLQQALAPKAASSGPAKAKF